MSTIRRWHVVIPGFMQSQGQRNGMVTLWEELYAALATGPEVYVGLYPWCSDWANIAEFMFLQSEAPEFADVRIYAYSWGGYSAMLLARELRRRGMTVRVIVLSDPVYRHSYALGQWRALVPWSRITVPSNVVEVQWFRQSMSLPAGHDLVAESEHTRIGPPQILTVDHCWMDDAARFHERCLELATSPDILTTTEAS